MSLRGVAGMPVAVRCTTTRRQGSNWHEGDPYESPQRGATFKGLRPADSDARRRMRLPFRPTHDVGACRLAATVGVPTPASGLQAFPPTRIGWRVDQDRRCAQSTGVKVVRFRAYPDHEDANPAMVLPETGHRVWRPHQGIRNRGMAFAQGEGLDDLEPAPQLERGPNRRTRWRRASARERRRQQPFARGVPCFKAPGPGMGCEQGIECGIGRVEANLPPPFLLLDCLGYCVDQRLCRQRLQVKDDGHARRDLLERLLQRWNRHAAVPIGVGLRVGVRARVTKVPSRVEPAQLVGGVGGYGAMPLGQTPTGPAADTAPAHRRHSTGP